MRNNIKTERLILRTGYNHVPFAIKHVQWLNDKQLMRYSEQRHQKHTPETQINYLRGFDYAESFFWDIEAGRPIGTVTAYCDWSNQTADVGILIGEEQRFGYGTEAWRAVCHILFKNGLRKIEAGCMIANTPMLKIFTKSGMHIEGRRHGHFLLNGKPVDMVLAGKFAP